MLSSWMTGSDAQGGIERRGLLVLFYWPGAMDPVDSHGRMTVMWTCVPGSTVHFFLLSPRCRARRDDLLRHQTIGLDDGRGARDAGRPRCLCASPGFTRRLRARRSRVSAYFLSATPCARV